MTQPLSPTPDAHPGAGVNHVTLLCGREARVLSSVTFTIEGLPLMAMNEQKRTDRHVYAAHRRLVAQHVQTALARQGVRTGTRSWAPWDDVTVAVVLRHPGTFDVDNKGGACKALLDVLQTPRRANPDGLGLILDDSDGEYGAPGRVKSFIVRQIAGPWAFTVEVRHVELL